MQTFLPYSSFARSARVLDRARLGKQRVEATQILGTLLRTPHSPDPKVPWSSHPAVNMWRGHERALAVYALTMVEEWERRGYRDTRKPVIKAYLEANGGFPNSTWPGWLGRKALHASHRSNLLRKMPSHYRQFWPSEPDDLPYVWPAN